MGRLWDWLTSEPNTAGETPNPNPPSSVGPSYNPGDPHGIEFEGEVSTERRALPVFYPSPWSGWPAEWSTGWDMTSRFNTLVDVAWSCLDINSSVLSAMPVYRTRNGQIIPATSWMTNPDETIYSDWTEFAKQLFWDFQLGEAFVLPMAHFSDGFPMRFRVIPPWAIDVQMEGGGRVYRLGGPNGPDVSAEILHIRYKSSADNPRGVGPLEVAGGRMVTAGLISRYIREFAESGGVVLRTIDTDEALDPQDAQDLQTQYMASRTSSASAPPVFDSGAKLVDHESVNPKDAAMVELGQFTESRIAVLLGVPPFLVGLPHGGDSMTYSNVNNLFDFHDRARLNPLQRRVMGALSYWALPLGQKVELNRDEYTRPGFAERAKGWKDLVDAGAVDGEMIRAAERFQSDGTVEPLTVLTGGEE